jgi:iron(III) transport system permease protein
LLRVPVFTTEVFTAFAALYDFGRATALALPLLLAALAVGFIIKFLIGERMITTSRSVRTGLPLSLGKWRLPAAAMVGFVILLSVLLPLTALVRESAGAWNGGTPIKDSGPAIVNSLALSTAGATAVVALGAFLGYGAARLKVRARGIAELIILACFALPGTVVAIGLIGLWNRPGTVGYIYKSMAIIVVACAARFLPVATLILGAGVRQIPGSSEEAAEVFGSGWFRIFGRIVIPQMRGAILAAWVIVFIFSFGELASTILIAPPGESTLPVRIYTLLANTTSNQVAALALMQAVIVLAPMVLLALVLTRKGDAI